MGISPISQIVLKMPSKISLRKLVKITATAVLVSSCMAGGATASNIYVEGSTPSRMYKVIKPVVGADVTPIFFLGSDALLFNNSVDPVLSEKAGVGEETIHYYLANLKPDSFKYGIEGYALGGYGAPGNEESNRTCAIVLATDAQMKTTSTMFHESVHCRAFADLRADPVASRTAVAMNRPSLGMTDGQFMSLFHEVLAAYIQVAYAANDGVVDGIGMVMRAAKPDKNTATSIGFRTARNALKVCGQKGACSTRASDVVRMLQDNTFARGQMMLDIKELFEAAKESGYVVENH